MQLNLQLSYALERGDGRIVELLCARSPLAMRLAVGAHVEARVRAGEDG
jgi:hypothetical protein